jgi:hypothetical protein
MKKSHTDRCHHGEKDDAEGLFFPSRKAFRIRASWAHCKPLNEWNHLCIYYTSIPGFGIVECFFSGASYTGSIRTGEETDTRIGLEREKGRAKRRIRVFPAVTAGAPSF